MTLLVPFTEQKANYNKKSLDNNLAHTKWDYKYHLILEFKYHFQVMLINITWRC